MILTIISMVLGGVLIAGYGIIRIVWFGGTSTYGDNQ